MPLEHSAGSAPAAVSEHFPTVPDGYVTRREQLGLRSGGRAVAEKMASEPKLGRRKHGSRKPKRKMLKEQGALLEAKKACRDEAPQDDDVLELRGG